MNIIIDIKAETKCGKLSLYSARIKEKLTKTEIISLIKTIERNKITLFQCNYTCDRIMFTININHETKLISLLKDYNNIDNMLIIS